MKLKRVFALICALCFNLLMAQDSSLVKKRLDFAKMYFEGGLSLLPSFTGKQLVNGQELVFAHSASLNPYLTWGGFHFWGHTEFYVTFPLNQLNLTEYPETNHELIQSVATGARFYPWAMKEGKLRPYLGLNWGALEFRQILKPNEDQTKLAKDFMLNYDAGLMYNYRKLALRLGVNYFADNRWEYPLSTGQMTEIKTPPLSFQMGLLYTFDATKSGPEEDIEEWNQYPRLSQLSYGAKRFGDFFLGAGPSLSFSLARSDYNASHFPYLQQRLASQNYFDLALGYHFNKANIFTALSFRNPTFGSEGFGTRQSIKKTSLALELNKFLLDYSGFAPYIGINVAYDHFDYEQELAGNTSKHSHSNPLEPGLSFGWDIVPGKTNEALILRTNLRWFPFSKFIVDGENFNFSQLEYNLIQVVFYPQRLKKKR